MIYSAQWRGAAEQMYEVRADTRQSRDLGFSDSALLGVAQSMPDGKSAVIEASESGRSNRLYIGDFKTWRSFTPEGIGGPFALAPDGSAAATRIGEAAYVPNRRRRPNSNSRFSRR
jgi:hypothetical protein